MTRTIYSIICVILFTLIVSCQMSWEERCANEALQTTQQTCPQQVYPDIWLDSLTYDAQQNLFTYYYHVDGKIDDPSIYEQEHENMIASLKQEIINSTDLKPKKDHGVGFRCIYLSGSTGKTYLDFSCTPADY